MSKPRNKTNRRRLHYVGVLAAAGLLTMGATGTTAWAEDFGSSAGQTIDAATQTDTTNGAVINGGNAVTWEVDTDSLSGLTTITGGLHFDSAAAATVNVQDGDPGTPQAPSIAGGIEVINTGSGTLSLGALNLTVTSGDINGGAAGLVFTGAGTITANSSDLYGDVTLGAGAASVKSVGVNGDADITVGAGTLTVGTTGFGNASTPTTSVINLTGAGALNAGTAGLAAGNTLTVNFNAAAGASAIGDLGAGSTLNVGGTFATGQALTIGNVVGGTTETDVTTINVAATDHYFTADAGTALTGYVNIVDNGTNAAQASTLVNVGDGLGKTVLAISGTSTKGVTATGDIIGDAADADKDTTIKVGSGAIFTQSGTGEVKGLVNAVNENTGSGAEANLWLMTLNGADLNVTGDITVVQTKGGIDNSITGTGTTYMDVLGFNGGGGGAENFNINGTTLALTNAGVAAAGTTFNLDSTGSDAVIDASNVTATTTLQTVNAKITDANNVIIRTSDQELKIATAVSDAASTGGTGTINFEATDSASGGFINLDGGVNITKVAGVNFKGDATIDAATNKDLKVPEINIEDSVFTVNNDDLTLLATTDVNLKGDVDFQLQAGAGTLAVDDLNTGGAAANTVTVTGIVTANKTNVLDGTTFDTDVTTNSKTTLTNGIQTKQVVIAGGSMTIATGNVLETQGGTGAAAPEIVVSDIGNLTTLPGGTYGTAIILEDKAAIASIGTGTSVEIGKNVAQEFIIADTTDKTATPTDRETLWGKFDGTITGESGTYIDYNKNTGLVFAYGSQNKAAALAGLPKYAKGYGNALLNGGNGSHMVFADALGNGYFDVNGVGSAGFNNGHINYDPATGHKVLNMAMGSTLNAVHMVSYSNNALTGIMNNLSTLHPQMENRIANSAGECETYGLWITPSFSFSSIDGDYKNGNGGDVDIKTYGLTVGFDGWINEQFRLGLFAGVSGGELDGDFQDIDSDAFQIGTYGQVVLPQGFMLNVGLGYSWQNYDAKRDLITGIVDQNGDSFDQRIKSDFDGNTLTAAIELNKTFALDYNMFLRPAIGYTYMGTELDSYREKSNAVTQAVNLSQRVNETDYDLHLFRIGTDIGWTGEMASVVGRAYYVGNAGDTDVKTRARLVNVPGSAFTIRGAEYDDSMANLGLTLKVAPTENTHFAIDYDALLGSNSTNHNVNLTFKYEW